MFSWLKDLFSEKVENNTPPEEPSPSPLVQKIADWVLSIEKKDMVTEGGTFDIRCIDSIEKGCTRIRYIVFDDNRSVEILRVEEFTLKSYDRPSYFVMEVKHNDVILKGEDLFEDNCDSENRPTMKKMFYHLKELYNYSSQMSHLKELITEQKNKYKNFIENF